MSVGAPPVVLLAIWCAYILWVRATRGPQDAHDDGGDIVLMLPFLAVVLLSLGIIGVWLVALARRATTDAHAEAEAGDPGKRLSIVIAGVLALSSATTRSASAHPPALVTIPVVTTREALLSVDPIAIDSTTTIRLGITGREVRLGEQVIVYCATSGYRAPERSEFADSALGPVRFVTLRKGRSPSPPGPESISLRGAHGPGPLVFTNAISTNSPGDYIVYVYAGDVDRLIASAPLVVHPTLSADACFMLVTAASEIRATDDDGKHATVHVGGRDGLAVVPRWDGNDPCPITSMDALLAPVGSASTAISVAADGDDLVLSVPDTVPAGIGGIDGQLAARLWIDGECYAPKLDTNVFHAIRVKRLRDPVRKLRVRVADVACDAKPKQRIEIQFALCPYGWHYLGLVEDGSRYGDERRIVLSNRVVLPGR